MGFSLGELFISLGFDVDDAKLKNFKSNLRDTHEEMVKLGTVAGGTITALTLFVDKAADGAVKLNNMQSLWGANTQAAQTFANALHQVNSQISVSTGQEKFRAFTEMINAKVPVGSGAYGALSLLGVSNPWANADEVLNEIRKNLPSRMASLGATPEKQRARASDLLAQIGLGDSLNAILEPDSKYQAASKYNIAQDALDKLGGYAKAAGELDEAFTKFSTDMASEIAPRMATAMGFLVKALNYLDEFNNAHPGASTVEGLAGAGVAGLGGWAILKKLGSWFGGGAAAGAASEEISLAAILNGAGGGGAAASGGAAAAGGLAWPALISAAVGGTLTWGSSWVGKKIGESLRGASFTDMQKAGIMHALNDESAMNPGAIGDHGLAYGIAQWHPDRQRNFALFAGHDIHGSSREEQLAFVNYELTKGMEREAGEKISQAKSEQEAYLLTKKYYERPAGSQNITIKIQSNATDNQEVANLVQQHFQRTINGAYAQTNLGAQQ